MGAVKQGSFLAIKLRASEDAVFCDRDMDTASSKGATCSVGIEQTSERRINESKVIEQGAVMYAPVRDNQLVKMRGVRSPMIY